MKYTIANYNSEPRDIPNIYLIHIFSAILLNDNNGVCHRSVAMENQLKQANMIVARSKKELGTPEVGQTVDTTT